MRVKGSLSSHHYLWSYRNVISVGWWFVKVRLLVRSLKDGQSKLDFHLIKQQEYGWDSGRVVVVHLIVFCFFAN